MIEKVISPASIIQKFWLQIAIGVWLVLLSILYLIFLQLQHSNIFFESQFLHIEFLKQLVEHRFNTKGVLTIFAEHLVPGYNFVLAINYYLFNIWGGFDGIVYYLSLIGAVGVIVAATFENTNLSRVDKLLIIVIGSLLLLSTTNNPQWGMALSASLGIPLFLFSIFKFSGLALNTHSRVGVAAYSAYVMSVLLFLGGYAVGVNGAIAIILIFWVLRERSISKRAVIFGFLTLACMVIYASIVTHYGSLFSNKPTAAAFDALLVVKFALLMIGSSLLGKTFFDQTQFLWIYYFCGLVLVYWCLCFIRQVFLGPDKTGIFFLAVLAYSLSNVLVVSVFRFGNGLEGALGQWYNVHTHFIGVVVAYYLVVYMAEVPTLMYRLAKIVSLIGICAAALVGYYFDWMKAEHIRPWKSRFAEQAPLLLGFPSRIGSKEDLYNTMLWNYRDSKAGIEFLYQNKLWIFQSRDPLVSGLATDHWMLIDSKVVIICPLGSSNLTFDAWRSPEWPVSKIIASYPNNVQSPVTIDGKAVSIGLDLAQPFILLEAGAFPFSIPMRAVGDDRNLLALINRISCSN